MAPRPPPRPRPLPLPGARPRPPRLPRPRPPRLGVSGDFTNASSIFVFSNTTLSSGVSTNIFRSDVEEFRLRLDRGVVHALGILSNASVILGSLILELVGSISSVGFCSSTKNFVAVSTIGSGSGSGCGLGSARLAPRPRPRPPLGLARIVGRSL